MNEKKNKNDERTRNWTFVVYPESAPENWRDIISDLFSPWVESPLHDRCVNEDGTPKKPHWHVAMFFKGKKSFDQMKILTDKLNSPIPQKVGNATGVVRYMAHMDNPEKAQYSPKDIVAYCGADIASYLKITKTNRLEMIAQMMNFVEENRITSFRTLSNYAREYRYDDWFQLLCDNSSFVLSQHIKSMRYDIKEYGAESLPCVYVDSETGEIIKEGGF
jgi:hypothetical protein